MARELEFDSMNLEALQRELDQLTLQAQTVCQTEGDRSQNCLLARHALDEMQAIVAEQQRAEQNRTFFERHCAEHPDALDCRIYDL
ncbi:MAG: CP12 domain-containing protein [Leptolyngbyaceae cyanobacterium bins.349]|nr:CP12 domain-containing protein [Leptolyngbyaceae cyanobacterium bins.349]